MALAFLLPLFLWEYYPVLAQSCGGVLSGAGSFWYPPNYPAQYPDFLECRWTITAPPGNVIQAQFSEPFGIPGRDFLAVIDGIYANQLGPACSVKDYFNLGTQGQAFILLRADKADFTFFTSTTNSMIAVFCAQGRRGSNVSRIGFRGQFFPVSSYGGVPNLPTVTVTPSLSATATPPPRTTNSPISWIPPTTPFSFPWTAPTVSPDSPSQCGIPIKYPGQARIIGGSHASFGSWPYMVAMVDSRYNGQFCGGVLIDGSWVLTAAHCVVDKPAQYLILRIGSTDFNASMGDASRGVDYRAAYHVVQPNFNSQNFKNDLALVRVSSPVEFTQFVRPICPPSAPPISGMICFIAGYGLTTPLSRRKRQVNVLASGSSRLMEADVPIVPRSTCQSFFDQAFPGMITLTSSHVCAGSVYPVSHDSCNGDSGGPLICQKNTHFEVAGITSFGIGCGRRDVFGAYTNIWELLPWINSVRGVQSTAVATAQFG